MTESDHNNNTPSPNDDGSTSRSSDDSSGRGPWNWFYRDDPHRIISPDRQQAEMYLVDFLLQPVFQHGRQIFHQSRPKPLQGGGSPTTRSEDPGVVTIDLTAGEKKVFKRPAYYGWTQGTIAGLTTCGLLVGGMRFRAARRLRHALPPPPRQSFRDLDGRKRTAASSRFEDPAPSTSPAPRSILAICGDAVADMQFIWIGALSLIVGSVVASACTDDALFLRNVAKVPLRPGKSYLCHAMCPDLLKHYQHLRHDTDWDYFLETVQQSEDESHGPLTLVVSLWCAPEQSPADLIHDPETEELESVLQLVQNCQRRLAYIEEIRQQNEVGDTQAEMDDPVTVPPPGVPSQFQSIHVDE